MLREIARYRVVLVHGGGPDRVRAVADQIVMQAAGSLTDAFAVTVCEADETEAIRSALASPSFTAPRRVVRVKEASERQVSLVRYGLAAADTLLVLEAGALTARSRLMAAADAPEARAINCTQDASDSVQEVRQTFAAIGVPIGEETARLVVGQAAVCGGSLQMAALRAALLAVGSREPAAVAAAALGDGDVQDRLDLAVLHGMAGRAATLDAGLESALAAGGSGIAWLRSGAMAMLRARGGRSPPGWSPGGLEAACGWLSRAERAAKTTGMPVELLARMALLALALGSERYDAFRSEIKPSS